MTKKKRIIYDSDSGDSDSDIKKKKIKKTTKTIKKDKINIKNSNKVIVNIGTNKKGTRNKKNTTSQSNSNKKLNIPNQVSSNNSFLIGGNGQYKNQDIEMKKLKDELLNAIAESKSKTNTSTTLSNKVKSVTFNTPDKQSQLFSTPLDNSSLSSVVPSFNKSYKLDDFNDDSDDEVIENITTPSKKYKDTTPSGIKKILYKKDDGLDFDNLLNQYKIPVISIAGMTDNEACKYISKFINPIGKPRGRPQKPEEIKSNYFNEPDSDNEYDNEVISEVIIHNNKHKSFDKWRKYKDDGLPDKEDLPLKAQKIDNILDNTPDNVTKRKSKDKRKTIQPIYQTPDGKIGDNQNETPALYENMDEKEIDGSGLKLNISSDKLHKNSLLDQISSATFKKTEPNLKVEKMKTKWLTKLRK